jgi:hypothetical protein
MLGFIRRIGKEFRDPYTLKMLNASFVRYHLDYVIVVWNPYSKRIEAIQKKIRVEIRVAYAGMEQGYRTTSVLSKVPFD